MDYVDRKYGLKPTKLAGGPPRPRKPLKGQASFWEPKDDNGQWKPRETLPDLSLHNEVWLDTEYDKHKKTKQQITPCGISIALADGAKQYMPFAHLEGGNLDEEKVKDWASRELRGKRIIGINIGGDAEALLNWGVDLERSGCSLHDIAHSAALLNENRVAGLNLNDLGWEYVNRGKLVRPGEDPVAPERIYSAHSSLIGPYAEEDAALTRDIDLVQRPLSLADDLGRVEALEDALIWANNYMERNASRLDMPKLEQWQVELAEEYSGLAIKIWEATGIKFNPNTEGSWKKACDFINMPSGKRQTTEGRDKNGNYTERLSTKEEWLKTIDHWLFKDGLQMRRIKSLESKYTDKYAKAQRDGILRWSLYQLRSDEENFGTIVGRYSSANINIQQVYKPGNQNKKFGPNHIIRELFIPDDGMDMFAVDGSQLQFRLFAHYSKDRKLIQAYKDGYERWIAGGDDVDFHQLVADLFNLERQAAKHNNFAMVLGMGREKLANRCDRACTCHPSSYWNQRGKDGGWKEHKFGDNDEHDPKCPATVSNDLADKYNKEFPAAKVTMKQISKVAEERGYIKTLLGRRRRYFEGDKFYSAFAGLLQGSEADLVKSKILLLYQERNTIGIHKIRQPVHDEITGDVPKEDLRVRRRLEDACKVQDIPCKVPISWNAGYGPDWAHCKESRTEAIFSRDDRPI